MRGAESGEVTPCGCRLGCGHDIGKPVRDHFERCGKWDIVVILAEGFVGFPCRVVAVMGRGGEGVMKKVFSFWHKVDILLVDCRFAM